MADTDAGLWHGTTILSVRKYRQVVVAGDGQVSFQTTVLKGGARPRLEPRKSRIENRMLDCQRSSIFDPQYFRSFGSKRVMTTSLSSNS